MTDRYQAPESDVEYEPGSDGKVLRNLQGITDPGEMTMAELFLLEQLYQRIFPADFPDRRLTIADLKRWHHQWLGNVYSWAGEERSVNMAKDGFQFAAAAQIPRLLEQFQAQWFDRLTPLHEQSMDALVEALAVTHVELILVHPFREGNGRLARLLADVMAAQAGCGLLDYSGWNADRSGYLAAIQNGMTRNYQPMADLVAAALGC
ncbi:MAG: Fic family protein [Nitrococcus sp.]|nr:Fic family protein [Nitrococcus sp.]